MQVFIANWTFLALIFPRPLSSLPSSCFRSLWLMVAIVSPIRVLWHQCRQEFIYKAKWNLLDKLRLTKLLTWGKNEPVGVLQGGYLLLQLRRFLLVVLQVCNLSPVSTIYRYWYWRMTNNYYMISFTNCWMWISTHAYLFHIYVKLREE